MNPRKTLATVLLTTLFVVMVTSDQLATAQTVSPQVASNQLQSEKNDEETNLDTQLYMLIATNQEVDDTKLPAALESVVRQLRASLPFKNYRLAATLINRVKNGSQIRCCKSPGTPGPLS